MKPEVVRPHRISPSRVLSALERAHERAPVVRGPACTTTVYYDQCPTGVWCYGEAGLSGWCRP